MRTRMDVNMLLADFVKHSRDSILGIGDGELYYGKDAECPEEWRQWVSHSGVLPPVLCPNGPGDLLKNLTAAVRLFSPQERQPLLTM